MGGFRSRLVRRIRMPLKLRGMLQYRFLRQERTRPMLTRRAWLLTAGAAIISRAAAVQRRIGLELGCISANKWTPYQYLDYLHKIRIGMAQFSEATLGVKPSGPDDAELRKVRAYAENLGISLSAFSG